jgi:hypothetical protein
MIVGVYQFRNLIRNSFKKYLGEKDVFVRLGKGSLDVAEDGIDVLLVVLDQQRLNLKQYENLLLLSHQVSIDRFRGSNLIFKLNRNLQLLLEYQKIQNSKDSTQLLFLSIID